MLHSHQELVEALKLDIDSLRREVGILRQEVERRETIDGLELEHQREILAQRKVEHKWDIAKGIGQVAGWALEHPEALDFLRRDPEED